MATASPELLAPDELADMMESPDFAALPAFERAQMFDAGLEESRTWLKTNAGDDEALSKAFDETAQAMAVKYRPAESDIELSKQGVLATGGTAAFRALGEVATGAVGGIAKAGAQYEKLRENLTGIPSSGAFEQVAGFTDRVAEMATDYSYPTNPNNPTAATIGSGAGQAAGLLGTAAASLPALGARAVVAVPAAIGGAMGMGQGIDTAEQMGIESPAGKLAMGTTFAGIEAGTEAIGGVGGKLLPMQGVMKRVTAPLVESGEEVLAGRLQDVAQRIAAPAVADPKRPGYTESGYKLPSLNPLDPETMARIKQEAIGGAAGGTVFAMLPGGGGDAAQAAPAPASSGQAVSPLGDIAAGTFVPDAQGVGQAVSDPPVRRAPILGNVPDGGRRMPSFQDDPLGATAPGGGGNVLRDFGIAKSPRAQVIADAANLEQQRQVAGMQVRNGALKTPMIPDSPLGGRDILDFINETPLKLAKKGSAEAGNAENDWSERFNVPMYYRKFIASKEGGYEPSTVAQAAYEQGLINEPTVDAMMNEVQSVIEARTQYRVQFRQRDKALRQEAQQVSNFETDQVKAANRDKTMVALEDVAVGDELTINDEKAVVRKIDYNEDGYLTNVVIEDGKRYGVLSLDPTTLAGVFVDEWAPRAREVLADDPFSTTVEDARVPSADATSGLAGVQPSGEGVQPQGPKGFTNTAITQDLEAGFLSDAGIDALFDLANAAITAGKTFVQWSAEMVKRFGDQIREYLAHVWAVAKDTLPTTAAQNVRLGGPAKSAGVRLNQAGAVGGMLGTMANGEVITVKVPDLERAQHGNLREIASVGSEDGAKDFRYNPQTQTVYWGRLSSVSEAERQKVADWLTAEGQVVKGHAQTSGSPGNYAAAHGVKLSQAGAVLNPFNLLPALKGGTKVFHAKGEPFRVNYLGARELLTGSPLPAELVPVLTRTNQEKRALEQRAAQLGRDLQTAINAYVDKSGLPVETVNEQVAAMMGGDVQAGALLSAVAPVLHERTRAVRVLLDNLSAAVAQTLPVGDMKTTIMGNLGAWLRRSYAAFDPASGWNYDALLRAAAAGTMVNGKDAAKILNDARAYLRAQNPQATAQQIESDLRDLMDRDVWERELTGSGAKKSTSSLMRRKDIAPEIRAVMGEEQNPVKLLTSSAGFQAQFIARHHGQVAMRNAGLATGLFATDRGGVYTEQVPENDRAWSGFNGVWTTPQMLKALDSASGVIKEGSDLGGMLVSTLKALGNKAKLNRVALNPDSWMVNILGNFTSLIQNGDVFAWSIINRVQRAREITGAGDAKPGQAEWNLRQTSSGQQLVRVKGVPGTVLNAAAEALQDASRDMQARLTEAGVLGSSLTLADLEASLPRHLLQWLALDQKADKLAGALEGAIVGQGMGRGLGMPGRAVGGAIGAVAGAFAGGTKIQGWQMKVADFLMTKPDALARTTGWLTNYESALASGMAPDAAATWASQRTLNTYPNYAALPGLMREASKLGIMGSFIAFQHEVYRNFGWNVRYAAEELRSGNPALMQRGLQRVAGIGAIASLAGGGLAALLAATGAAGGDDERNKLFRKWFGAPWEKDAVLAFREFDAEKVSYFNTSYLLPQTTMVELLQAMREGENPADAAGRVVDRLYEQFVGSSVHLGPLLSATMNQKRSGAKLTYQTGVAGALERADEPLKTILEPGFAEKIERLTYAVREAERNGTKYSIEQEFRRIIGLRETTKTWPKMVEGVYRSLADENSNIRAQANREVSLNRPGASKRAVDAANAQIDTLRQKVADFERDAVKLGVPEQVIIRAKREASVGKLPSVGLQADGKRVISLGR